MNTSEVHLFLGTYPRCQYCGVRLTSCLPVQIIRSQMEWDATDETTCVQNDLKVVCPTEGVAT